MPDCPADWQATPEQVSADQRRDVARAVTSLGRLASVERVVEQLHLHPFVVVRRLKELGLDIPGMGWQPERVARSEKQRAETTGFLNDTRKANAKPTN